jgi:hypothetical protein
MPKCLKTGTNIRQWWILLSIVGKEMRLYFFQVSRKEDKWGVSNIRCFHVNHTGCSEGKATHDFLSVSVII